MRSWKTMFAISAAALLMVVVPGAKAERGSAKTVLTFNEPVEIPGVVLEPGSYVFKLLGLQQDRDVVEVYNKAEDHLYATLVGIPITRETAAGQSAVMFEQRAPDSPETIKAWFRPGRVNGVEFIYPKERARQLARLNKEDVMSMPSDMQDCITTPTKSANDAHVKRMKSTHVTAMSQSGQEKEVTLAQSGTPAKR